VGQPEVVELDRETAEVERHAILVDLVRLDQLDALQLIRDPRPERAEELQVRDALVGQLLLL
jgi:hypothetical protein